MPAGGPEALSEIQAHEVFPLHAFQLFLFPGSCIQRITESDADCYPRLPLWAKGFELLTILCQPGHRHPAIQFL